MAFGGFRHISAASAVASLDKAVNVVIVMLLVGMLGIGCYDLWDSRQFDAAASSAQWQPYKPARPDLPGFAELQKMNPDVVGWLELYGTGVDYPVCYRDDQSYYLNHDAKGNASLTGSLFLDKHNKPDFSDPLSIVYGHHMQVDLMFGPLSNFLKGAYFDEHEYGNLHSVDGDRGLDIIACVKADAYDSDVFRVNFSDVGGFGAYLDQMVSRAENSRPMALGEDDNVLLLATCSSEATNARTVLLAKVCDETFDNPFAEAVNVGIGVDAPSTFLGAPWYAWAATMAFVVLMAAIAIVRRDSFPTSGEKRGGGR